MIREVAAPAIQSRNCLRCRQPKGYSLKARPRGQSLPSHSSSVAPKKCDSGQSSSSIMCLVARSPVVWTITIFPDPLTSTCPPDPVGVGLQAHLTKPPHQGLKVPTKPLLGAFRKTIAESLSLPEPCTASTIVSEMIVLRPNVIKEPLHSSTFYVTAILVNCIHIKNSRKNHELAYQANSANTLDDLWLSFLDPPLFAITSTANPQFGVC